MIEAEGGVLPYQVFELTFQHQHEMQYTRPNWDVTIEVDFVSPPGFCHSGRRKRNL